MGWSLGAAMGAKLAAPDRVVVDMIGDGSFGMTGMDLETAVRCEIPILVVVINNYLLNLSAETRRQKFQERYLMVELTGNYTRVAEGLGAHAEKVQKPGEIRAALERAVRVTREGKPALVEVTTKRLEPLPKGGTYVSRAASTRLRPMDIG
jgi:acetolactate synthase-1/2/3 large subunit